MAEAIRFENLWKVYREGFWGKKIEVIRDLSFTVPRGLVFGFLGANGAGKTTCIKILMGLQSASRGKAFCLGKACYSEEARQKIGYLPERPYFHDNLSAKEFLNFHRSLRNAKKSRTNSELLALVGIPGTEKKLLRDFSKGMLQRIGIAQALLGDPELVILDEPMSGLDPLGRRDMRKLIIDLANEGKSIFFSTHILADVESICQEIAFLEKGKLRYQGKLKELLGESQEFEIVFSELAPALVKSQFVAATALGQAWRLNVNGEKKSRELVEQLWQKGAVINSYGHTHRNLEETLFGVKEERHE